MCGKWGLFESIFGQSLWQADGHENHKQRIHLIKLKIEHNNELEEHSNLLQLPPLHNNTLQFLLNLILPNLRDVILQRW
jgi:hypothetical protein